MSPVLVGEGVGVRGARGDAGLSKGVLFGAVFAEAGGGDSDGDVAVGDFVDGSVRRAGEDEVGVDGGREGEGEGSGEVELHDSEQHVGAGEEGPADVRVVGADEVNVGDHSPVGDEGRRGGREAQKADPDGPQAGGASRLDAEGDLVVGQVGGEDGELELVPGEVGPIDEGPDDGAGGYLGAGGQLGVD